jgi:DNA polymerase-4
MSDFESPRDGIATPEESAAIVATQQRKIIHIDMDAFYASVEQRDHPELRGKPVAVGGSRARGVVMAASYEARRFGVHSAMPSVTARRKCPELIFVQPHFDVYNAVTHRIREIFADHTALVEPLALDEAYLDVTENRKQIASATQIAAEIRAEIFAQTGLTASAGVSYNKFLAKMASNHCKPDGLFVITPKMGPAFVETLAVEKFHGIGPATRARMERLGIRSGSDLKVQTLPFLQQHFGKAGTYYYWLARGIDERPVWADRERKSIGVEITFDTDLFSEEDIRAALKPIVEKLWHHCERTSIRGRTVTLKVKYADFQRITRSRTDHAPFTSCMAIEKTVIELADSLVPVSKGVRLLGVTLSSLGPEISKERQLRLSI